MNIIELILISIGLGMDACSVAICKGLCMNKFNICKCVIIAIWFASFQLIMPIIGFYFGGFFGDNVKMYSHLVAFFLLILLGINMIRDSKNNDSLNDDISPKSMILPSIATSIDALTIGITFSLLNINIFISSIIIFIVTFILSIMGVIVGNIFGVKYKSKSQIIGGIILIIMGFKMIV